MIIGFVGDNGPAREQALKKYIGEFTAVHGSSAIVRMSGDNIDLNDLADNLATAPFLSTKRMFIVRDLGLNKTASENFSKLIDNMAESTVLVVVESHIDSRSKYLKELKKQAEVREFVHLEGEDLLRWVIDQAKESGGSISYEDARYLIDRVGTNHQLLANEVAKLILYSPQIYQESIDLLTSYMPQSSVFAMLDAIFAGKIDRAIKLYAEQRTMGMEPQAILGMIGWQLNAMAIVKSADNMAVQQIANESRLNPFVVRKNLSLVKYINRARLLKMIDNVLKADRLLKTSSANADDVLQTLIMTL